MDEHQQRPEEKRSARNQAPARAGQGGRAYGKGGNGKPGFGAGKGDGRRMYGAKPAQHGKPGPEGENRRYQPAGQGDKSAYGQRRTGNSGGSDAPRAFDKPYAHPEAKPVANNGQPRGGKPMGNGSRGSYGKPASGNRGGFRSGGRTGQGTARPGNRPAPARPKAPGADAPSTISRRVALEIFQDVVRKDAFAALSLDDKLKNVNLSQLDKRFCASIVYRTIENLIRIDYALSFFLKDADALDPRVRDILRISACQLLFHDRIPENAVVDEAVKLTRELGLEGLTGLTNAVLRSLVRGKDEIKWPAPEEGARYLSIMYSVPLWLAERLTQAYGPDMARDICAYRNEAHFTTIRPNLSRFTDAEFEALLQKKVWEVEKGKVAHAYRVRLASEIARDADYLAGNFSIQGESSMLAAQAVDAGRGMQILDCCAAPGGKTAYIAEQMAGTGRVYAWDVHDHRVALIRAMAHRLRLDNVRPVVRDATVVKDELIGTMDAVLLDAPCSGLGVMDNKPDIKLRASRESVDELTRLQEKLLDSCCQYVKRGGVLVYSTCSMLPEENAQQIQRFLERHSAFEIAPLPAGVGADFRALYGAYGLQLLPHRDGVEGFFIARLRRVK